jgi:hypothetical protein
MHFVVAGRVRTGARRFGRNAEVRTRLSQLVDQMGRAISLIPIGFADEYRCCLCRVAATYGGLGRCPRCDGIALSFEARSYERRWDTPRAVPSGGGEPASNCVENVLRSAVEGDLRPPRMEPNQVDDGLEESPSSSSALRVPPPTTTQPQRRACRAAVIRASISSLPSRPTRQVSPSMP